MIRATTDKSLVVVSFKTELGWCALVGNESELARLTIAQTSEVDALRKVEATELREAPRGHHLQGLARRLKRYAQGDRDDFLDVEIDESGLTEFQRQVVNACRQIEPGSSASYGELAALAGGPRGARAVGNVMRTNRIPIIVPCHRVLASQGKIGGYSLAPGLTFKRQLLALEGHPDFCGDTLPRSLTSSWA